MLFGTLLDLSVVVCFEVVVGSIHPHALQDAHGFVAQELTLIGLVGGHHGGGHVLGVEELLGFVFLVVGHEELIDEEVVETLGLLDALLQQQLILLLEVEEGLTKHGIVVEATAEVMFGHQEQLSKGGDAFHLVLARCLVNQLIVAKYLTLTHRAQLHLMFFVLQQHVLLFLCDDYTHNHT